MKRLGPGFAANVMNGLSNIIVALPKKRWDWPDRCDNFTHHSIFTTDTHVFYQELTKMLSSCSFGSLPPCSDCVLTNSDELKRTQEVHGCKAYPHRHYSKHYNHVRATTSPFFCDHPWKYPKRCHYGPLRRQERPPQLSICSQCSPKSMFVPDSYDDSQSYSAGSLFSDSDQDSDDSLCSGPQSRYSHINQMLMKLKDERSDFDMMLAKLKAEHDQCTAGIELWEQAVDIVG